MMAIDKLRDCRKKVGLFRIRLWRPFPYEELRQTVKKCQNLDRSGPGYLVRTGRSGSSEIKSALYPLEKKPKVVGFVGGLGGRDISPADFEAIIKRGIEIAKTGSEREFEIFGVRE